MKYSSPFTGFGVFSGSLRGSLVLITIAGCLGTAFLVAVTSPATTEFFRVLGANELHFGLLSGIPLAMLIIQFCGVLLVNRLRRRKPAFIVMVILSRLLYLPVAFIPVFWPELRTGVLLPLLILTLTVSSALNNLVVPLWFSWMGDLIPRRRLSSYWGKRMVANQVVWILSYLVILTFIYATTLPITMVFPAIATIGVAAGVVDILLFLKVHEPQNHVVRHVQAWSILTAPFRDVRYRQFVIFNCAWMAAAMLAAAFMQVYVLKELQLGVWRTIMIWTVGAVGGALTAQVWGRLADKHGNRPIIVLCITLKSMIVVVFLLITRQTATVALSIAFLFDGVLNAGVQIATNGYMLKLAPRENRSAFIAAITGLAGLCGGLAALGAGFFLRGLAHFSWDGLGRTWGNYHLLFATSLVLRLACIILVRRIQEPTSTASIRVFSELGGVWPFRLLLFPVGLYRQRPDDTGPPGKPD